MSSIRRSIVKIPYLHPWYDFVHDLEYYENRFYFKVAPRDLDRLNGVPFTYTRSMHDDLCQCCMTPLNLVRFLLDYQF